MIRPSWFSHRVRGQALSELQGSVLVGALVIAGLVFLFARLVASNASANTYEQGEGTTIALFKEFQRGGAAAQSVNAQAADVANASNADGHEFELYQIDGGASRTGHFYAYCYKATAGDCGGSQALNTLQRYTYLWQDLPQHGGAGATAQSSAETGITAFKFSVLTTAAQYEDSTLDPYAATYFQRHPPNLSGAKTYHWGYPGVTSSTNDLYVVQLTLSNGDKRSFAFSKHHIVFAQQIITGTATPTPNPIRVGGGAAATLNFARPCCVGSQSATITESNYGVRSTTPAQVYTFDTGCASVATYTPSSPVTPANDGTGSATITVRPIKQVAASGLACTLTGTDNAGQTVGINVSVGRTYTPSVTNVNPVVGVAGQSGTITVGEANYDRASNGGGFTASLASTGVCAVPALTGESVDASNNYVATYSVSYSAIGICQARFTDTYGQVASVDITVKNAPLVVWPPAVQLPGGGSSLSTLAYDGKPRDAGAWINRFLGGGIAEAAVAGCGVGQGRAMDGIGWDSTHVLAGQSDPWGAGLSTDANGCITGPAGGNVVAHEAGYNGAFLFNPLSCGGAVKGGLPWSSGGPTAWTQTIGSAAVTCIANIQDNNPSPQTTPLPVQVLACLNGSTVSVGASCGYTWVVPNNYVPCDSGGIANSSHKDGFDGNSAGLAIGPGSVGTGTTSGNTFTRTSPGVVFLQELGEFITDKTGTDRFGALICKGSTTSNDVVRTVTVN